MNNTHVKKSDETEAASRLRTMNKMQKPLDKLLIFRPPPPPPPSPSHIEFNSPMPKNKQRTRSFRRECHGNAASLSVWQRPNNARSVSGRRCRCAPFLEGKYDTCKLSCFPMTMETMARTATAVTPVRAVVSVSASYLEIQS